ncbi:hypothetical protein H5T88_04870 [bacterium]|nr:hypothetical protein [bacterium]
MSEGELWSGKETMFGTHDFPSAEEIVEDYSKEFQNYIKPKGENIFGFWMQTIADIEFLDLELQGLTESYYSDFIDTFGDTNAYAFHNLYPLRKGFKWKYFSK